MYKKYSFVFVFLLSSFIFNNSYSVEQRKYSLKPEVTKTLASAAVGLGSGLITFGARIGTSCGESMYEKITCDQAVLNEQTVIPFRLGVITLCGALVCLKNTNVKKRNDGSIKQACTDLVCSVAVVASFVGVHLATR